MMATTTLLLGAALVLLIIGLALFVSGMRSSPKDEAVPLTGMKEFQKLKEVASDFRRKKESKGMVQHILKENLKKEGGAALTPLQEASSLPVGPSVQETLLQEKLYAAEEHIAHLEAEKQKLISESRQQPPAVSASPSPDALAQAQKATALLQQEVSQRLEQYQLLEKEVGRIQKENETLKQQGAQSQTRLEQLHAELQQAQQKIKQHSMQEDFAGQLKISEQRMKQLEETLQVTRDADEKNFQEAQQTIRLLRSQQEMVDQEQLERMSQQCAQIQLQLDAIKQENSRLVKTNMDDGKDIAGLKASQENLKAHNEQLLQRGKKLQYELAKSRAQSLGLEKICEDFRIQINDLSKTLESVKGG
jgi:chromosome segregation ATPase